MSLQVKHLKGLSHLIISRLDLGGLVYGHSILMLLCMIPHVAKKLKWKVKKKRTYKSMLVPKKM